MSKSAGNGFLPGELFTGNHPLLDKGYSPMAVRFFMMQTHYRSTLDFSNEALRASEKGYRRIINGLVTLKTLVYQPESEVQDEKLNTEIERLCELCYAGMNDDFNSAIVIANLFNLLKYINSFSHKIIPLASLSETTFEKMKTTFIQFVEDILGLKEEKFYKPNLIDDLYDILLELYKGSKETKDYARVDFIRKRADAEGIIIKDTKEGVSWSYKE